MGAGIEDASSIARRRTDFKARYRELEKRHTLHLLEGEVRKLRESLEGELLRRWPEAGYPYTHAFQRFLTRNMEAAQAFILAHPDYPRLVELQNDVVRTGSRSWSSACST